MNSQTVRRPDNQRSTRSAKTKRYTKQTAHVEARRDGKPLIFGWGGHLSRSEKVLLQRRAIWSATIVFAVLIVAVIVGYWVNINVITPNLPITAVNGQPIPQSTYRKLLALNAQMQLNQTDGPHGLKAQRDDLGKQVAAQQKVVDDTTKKIDDLNKQIKATPASDKAQLESLKTQLATQQKQLTDAKTKYDTLNAQYQNMVQNVIPQAQQLYNQSQLGNVSVGWLQDDVLIQQWMGKQSKALAAQIEPTPAAVNAALKDFAANLPKATNYEKFLKDDNVSDADMHAMMTLKLRRDNLQKYLASQIASPAYQVQVRAITVATSDEAKKYLQQIKSGSDFAQIAKDKSLDNASKPNGGELGWLARGQYTANYAANQSAVIDNWIFDKARKANELSPVLSENGTFHIVQIQAIDPSRVIDGVTLEGLKTNALDSWLLTLKAQSGVKITPIDQTKLLDPSNIPPGLPLSTSSQVPGAPSGGYPGDGLPGSDDTTTGLP